ncbi:carbohydrate sulfotransferase 3-like isoform X2 [Argopecten irradians]|uniref:carbohydrate sulfotransferase 3-like isoform X2 n=1 Tax=Argopecten irradians TaxID=31199 RepID=UPI0037213B66
MMSRRQQHLFGLGLIILTCVCYSFLDDTVLKSSFSFVVNAYRGTVGTGRLEAGRDESTESLKTGGTVGTGRLEAGRDGSTESLKTGGTVGTGHLEAGRSVNTEGMKTGGTVGTGHLEAGGSVNTEGMKTRRTVGTGHLEAGGSVNTEGMKTRGNVGTVRLEADRDRSTGRLEAGRDGSTGSLKTGGTVGTEGLKVGGTVGTGRLEAGGTAGTGSLEAGVTKGTGRLEAGVTKGTGRLEAGGTAMGTGGLEAGRTVGTGRLKTGGTVSTGRLEAGGTAGIMGTMTGKGTIGIGSQTYTSSDGSREYTGTVSVGGLKNIGNVGLNGFQKVIGSLKDSENGSIASQDDRRNGNIASVDDRRNGSIAGLDDRRNGSIASLADRKSESIFIMMDRRLEKHTGLNESEYRLPPFTNPSDVLVVAYLKGGSTFLGDMLGFKTGNFYIYEPLHNLVQFGYFDTGDLNCTMLNESCSKGADTDWKILKVLRGIYNCDNQKYQHLLRSWQYQKSMGPKHKERCVTRKTFDECAEQYLTQCVNARSKVSKVPRISISLASELLSEFPNLKIVHLLRDPRGIVNSRLSLPWNIPLSGGAVSLCSKMTRDFQEAIKIKQAYPGRLYTVYYEDLAQNPRKGFSLLYKFLGYIVDITDIRRLKEMTASFKDAGRSQTRRHDSSKTASKWRDQMNSTVLAEINKACSPLYTLLGYPQLKSIDDLKNTSIPLKYDINSINHYT